MGLSIISVRISVVVLIPPLDVRSAADRGSGRMSPVVRQDLESRIVAPMSVAIVCFPFPSYLWRSFCGRSREHDVAEWSVV